MSTKLQQKTSDLLLEQTEALLTYAKINKEFESYLLANLPDFQIEDTAEYKEKSVSPWLLPDSEYIAEKRLQWLLNEIDIRPKLETAPVTSLLASYKHHVLPKNPLFGIIGVAIIGPTLGILSRKKKRRSQMRVLFTDATYRSLSKAKLYKLASQISLRLLSKELEKVGGNAYRLMPDTAEWLFTDQKNELASLTNINQLKSAQAFLQKEGLSYETLEKNGKIIALAISPTISEEFIDHIGATKIDN